MQDVLNDELMLCRRALDLVYALVNEGNIQSLTKELLEYLQVADAEFKPDLTAKIAALVQRFAPNKRWHFDSLLQVPCAFAQGAVVSLPLKASLCTVEIWLVIAASARALPCHAP